MEDLFKNKKPNSNKLKRFGFQKSGESYLYSTNIMDDDFILNINISDTEIKTEVLEKDTNEPYTLHLVESAGGKFVGKIKYEYEQILNEIAEKCYDTSVFEWEYTHKVLDYAMNKYKTEPEYLWEKFPRNAVCRRKDNNKWYFAILTVKANRLGFDSEEIIEIIDLRTNPKDIDNLTKQQNIYPGYHMNKKHWISIVLDGSMDIEEIFNYIDKSYELAC